MKVLYILLGGLVFFTITVVVVSLLFPGSEKMFALFAGILGNFSGSLFTWLQLSHASDPASKPAEPLAVPPVAPVVVKRW